MSILKNLFIGALFTTSSLVASASDFTLTSPDIRPDTPLSPAQVLNGFGCHGQNISPAMAWHNAPFSAKSFAITFYDPDAPTGSGWWHWVVYNLPAATNNLPENAGAPSSKKLPTSAVQGLTDFAERSYGGAYPPAGDKPHRYILTVYALNTEKIELPTTASAAMVGFMLNAHLLAKTSITATFGR